MSTKASKSQQQKPAVPPPPVPVEVKNAEPLKVAIVSQPESKLESAFFTQYGGMYFHITDFTKVRINPEQQNALQKLFSSGSIKNESSTTVWIRLTSSQMISGYMDIMMNPSEVLKWKDLLIESISVPQSTLNASVTVNLSCVVWSYLYERSTPSIELE